MSSETLEDYEAMRAELQQLRLEKAQQELQERPGLQWHQSRPGIPAGFREPKGSTAKRRATPSQVETPAPRWQSSSHVPGFRVLRLNEVPTLPTDGSRQADDPTRAQLEWPRGRSPSQQSLCQSACQRQDRPGSPASLRAHIERFMQQKAAIAKDVVHADGATGAGAGTVDSGYGGWSPALRALPTPQGWTNPPGGTLYKSGHG